MKKIFSLTFLLFSIASNAQISFESGYIVDNNGTRTTCLIRNFDWNDNPSAFKYKLDESSEILEGSLISVKEFGVEGLKYKRFDVGIDETGNNTGDLDSNPLWVLKPKTLFLEQLVEGKATLFRYVNGSQTRFFYTIDNSDIKILEYKSYLLASNKIAENVRYKQTLLNDLKCEKVTASEMQNLNYNQKSLSAIFRKYNSCFETKTIEVVKETRKTAFHLTVRPGVLFSSFDMALDYNSIVFDDVSVDFGNKASFRIGLEAEVILPVNKNKWAVFLEPTFQGLKNDVAFGTGKATIDYQSIEIPVGIRHYFFLRNQSKLFVNFALEIDIPLKMDVYSPQSDYSKSFELKSKPNASLGFGYKYNAFSLEARYKANRKFTNQETDWIGNYGGFSVILGYTVF